MITQQRKKKCLKLIKSYKGVHNYLNFNFNLIELIVTLKNFYTYFKR